jgi:diguanylate cyclase (GGDEF)-like protein/PAS domain S-box-containing protein
VTQNSREVFIGKSPKGVLELLDDWKRFFDSIVDEDKARVTSIIEDLHIRPEAVAELEFRVNCENNVTCWYRLYGKSFADGQSPRHRVVGVLQDTTDSHIVEDKLVQAATVFECTAEGIVILDNSRQVDCINDAFTKITGFEQDELIAMEIPFLRRHFLGVDVYNGIWHDVKSHGHWQGEVTAYRKNDEKFFAWLNIGVVPGPSEEVVQYVLVMSDITAIREAQEQLSHLAYFDSLTELPNRMLIMDRLGQAIAKAGRENARVAVLFVDLDNFKRVNDTMGHQVGDKMLRAVGDKMLRAISGRLNAVLRVSDTMGRLGGDEFIVIMESVDSFESISVVGEKLLKSIARPLMIGDTELIPSCSIGVSIYPDDSSDHNELVQMADTAMYAAKNNGRNNYVFYHPDMTQSTAHYLTRERELYHALEEKEFELFYQPQCSPGKGVVTGVEALIRWHHPQLGLLSPGEVIPVAESSTLIINIGEWVLEDACRQLSEWREQGLGDIRVAVNISIRQLGDDQLPDFVAELLQRYLLPAHLLELEITESCLQNDAGYIMCLQRLAKLGVTISIDDFGTGYSCMSSLKHLPIGRLKIDQAFVRDIPMDNNDCAIASAILALGHQLNMEVVAEGVETMEQIEFLDAIGCDELQGYFFGKPGPADEIPVLVNQLGSRLGKLFHDS